jgi:tetratricopeptide (TPR) repeat protein
MEPITAILGAGLVIAGRKFAINKGKKFVIELLDKYDLLPAKIYLNKAMECGDLDLSIEYTLKALKKNPNYKPALNWKEILQINIENKIENLQNIRSKFIKEIEQKNSELKRIRNIQSELKNNILNIKSKIIPNIIKYTFSFIVATALLSYLLIFFFRIISNNQLIAFSGLISASIILPISVIYISSLLKISLIRKEIHNYEESIKILQREIEEINLKLKGIEEGIEILKNRKKILNEHIL